jgi:hypothetical protein
MLMLAAKFSHGLLLSLVTQLLLHLAELLVIVKRKGMKKKIRENMKTHMYI